VLRLGCPCPTIADNIFVGAAMIQTGLGLWWKLIQFFWLAGGSRFRVIPLDRAEGLTPFPPSVIGIQIIVAVVGRPVARVEG
jgi:hypothetical protein